MSEYLDHDPYSTEMEAMVRISDDTRHSLDQIQCAAAKLRVRNMAYLERVILNMEHDIEPRQAGPLIQVVKRRIGHDEASRLLRGGKAE